MDVKKYINMSEEDKWWKNYEGFAEGVNDVPLMENHTDDVKNSEFIELQNSIDKLVYEFMKSHNISDAWCLEYSIDSLQSLKECGCENPFCDGSLTIFDKNKKVIMCSM